jgi:heme exporter protein D
MTLQEFLHMGGYAVYVWPSYGLAAVVMAINVWLAQRRRSRFLDQLRRQEERRQSREEVSE